MKHIPPKHRRASIEIDTIFCGAEGDTHGREFLAQLAAASRGRVQESFSVSAGLSRQVAGLLEG